MTKETYMLPIRVEIQAENPDLIMREVAESIYDSINSYALANIELHPGRHIDVQWSIYKKPNPAETFGLPQQMTGK